MSGSPPLTNFLCSACIIVVSPWLHESNMYASEPNCLAAVLRDATSVQRLPCIT